MDGHPPALRSVQSLPVLSVLQMEPATLCSPVSQHVEAEQPPTHSHLVIKSPWCCSICLLRQIQNKSAEKRKGPQRKTEWEERGGREEACRKKKGEQRGAASMREEPWFLILLLSLLFSSTAKQRNLIYIPAHVCLPTASGGSLISHNWRDGFFKTSL